MPPIREHHERAIEGFTDWGKPDLLSQFLKDVEMSWFNRTHAVAEW